MFRLFLSALIVLPILIGCSKSPTPHDPSRVYIGQIVKILVGELKRDELKSIPIAIDRYRNFGLRVKSVSDANVQSELTQAAQEWANSSISFANVLATFNELPGDNDAIVEGTVRLLFGAAPISVWDRESNRVGERNRRMMEMEIAHTKMSAAEADFVRIQNRLFPEWIGQSDSTNPSAPNDGRNQSSAMSAKEAQGWPFDRRARFILDAAKCIYSWVGWSGILIALTVGAVVSFYPQNKSSVANQKSSSPAS
jgi:hypothetical protein